MYKNSTNQKQFLSWCRQWRGSDGAGTQLRGWKYPFYWHFTKNHCWPSKLMAITILILPKLTAWVKLGDFVCLFKKATYLEFESTKSRKSSEPGTVAAWWWNFWQRPLSIITMHDCTLHYHVIPCYTIQYFTIQFHAIPIPTWAHMLCSSSWLTSACCTIVGGTLQGGSLYTSGIPWERMLSIDVLWKILNFMHCSRKAASNVKCRPLDLESAQHREEVKSCLIMNKTF